ncbi:MAG: IS66 family insertion sequence element accessory protein TnpB [Deltaproteobacteria bacterium]|nr:IS66 family insertion sequence element accessory protein TnpB [Deltaproteobacteria bacterium]MBT4526380.1 IS66 family insertion sequence element accessory protein TnpB [Deltaproteobacteria bacterium]
MLRAFWSSHLEQWSETNMSQADYCRQHGLSSRSFTYWKTKYKKKNLPVEFVQLTPEAVGGRMSDLKLNIGSGLQVEIPDGSSQATLERVLMTLKIL